MSESTRSTSKRDKTVPRFREIVGKSGLDYGCGMGDQAVALKLLEANSVTGYDPYPRFPTDRTGMTEVSGKDPPNSNFAD